MNGESEGSADTDEGWTKATGKKKFSPKTGNQMVTPIIVRHSQAKTEKLDQPHYELMQG